MFRIYINSAFIRDVTTLTNHNISNNKKKKKKTSKKKIYIVRVNAMDVYFVKIIFCLSFGSFSCCYRISNCFFRSMNACLNAISYIEMNREKEEVKKKTPSTKPNIIFRLAFSYSFDGFIYYDYCWKISSSFLLFFLLLFSLFVFLRGFYSLMKMSRKCFFYSFL